MPGTKKKTASASTVSAREMWLQAVKSRTIRTGSGTQKATSSSRKSPGEFWMSSLRRSQGRESESVKHKDDMISYLSTSHYLREKVGTETPRSIKNSMLDGPVQGTPAYKTQEEYYDEVLELRKTISELGKTNSTMKARLRRLEEDKIKKDREIETFQKHGVARSTIGGDKSESGATVLAFKQKVLKLEQQLRNKDNQLRDIQGDVKYTHLEEIRLKMEMFYQEILRLQKNKNINSSNTDLKSASSTKSSSKTQGRESTAKVKALNETILRLNKKNMSLVEENKILREDTEKLISELSLQKNRTPRQRKQISARSSSPILDETTTSKLEVSGNITERLEQLDKRETELISEIDSLNKEVHVYKSREDNYRDTINNKRAEIKVLNDHIEKLESELYHFKSAISDSKIIDSRVSDTTTLRKQHSRDQIRDRPSSRGSDRDKYSDRESRDGYDGSRRESRDPRNESRQESRDARNESRQESRDVLERRDSYRSERPDSARRGSERPDSARRGSERRGSARRISNRERDRKLQDIRENHAARTIQKGWREHQNEERAAVCIQSAARANKARNNYKYSDDDDSGLDEAALVIQSATRSHYGRKQTRPLSRGSSYGDDSEDLDDFATTIQSSYRSHKARNDYLENSERNNSRNKTSLSDSRGRKMSGSNDSDLDSGYSGVRSQRPRSANLKRGGVPISPSSSRRSTLTRSNSKSNRVNTVSDDDDDDDDILM